MSTHPSRVRQVNRVKRAAGKCPNAEGTTSPNRRTPITPNIWWRIKHINNQTQSSTATCTYSTNTEPFTSLHQFHHFRDQLLQTETSRLRPEIRPREVREHVPACCPQSGGTCWQGLEGIPAKRGRSCRSP